MIPALEPVAEFTVQLSPPHEQGPCPDGTRRIIPIVGGTVAGPRLNGHILDLGADWQTVLANGVAELDARYALQTDDGAVIQIESKGIRDASPEVAARIASGEQVPTGEYYMRTAIRLTTGHPAYTWVNRSLFLATGGKVGAVVRLQVFRVG